MEFIKAIVKKYSREYTRTLKDGNKKKYHTEQVQITIPKENDVFEDNEKVFIIKSSDINKVKEDSGKINELKAKNEELEKDNGRLKSTIEKNNSTIYEFERTINDLEEKLDLFQKKLKEKSLEKEKVEEKLEKSIETLKNSKNEMNELKSEDRLKMEQKNNENAINQELSILEKDKLINKLNRDKKELEKDKKDLEEKLDILRSYIDDLKNITETLKSSQNNEILKLEDKCNKLAIKYRKKKEALKKAEEEVIYQERIAEKLKKFILNSY